MAIRSFRITGWLLILTITFLSGCAHKAAVEPPTGSYLEDIYATANTNPDVDLFNTAMPPYLQYMDSLIGPDSAELLLYRLSGAYYGYAFCFVEDTDKKEASSLYLKGRDYALTELKRYRIFLTAMTYDSTILEFKKSLPASFDKKTIQPLYWAAMNWAGWINLNLDKPEALADIPKVEAMLEFVNELDSSYNSGSVYAVLGSLHANLTKEQGGNTEKARDEFDNAFTYSGNSYLTFHVMYAQYYARQIQDRELFKKTLATVLETPANTYAEKTFVNEIARRKAKVLLDNIDKYFKATETKKGGEAVKNPQQ
jgi:tetratricopeptide (TPR) repeat protein